MSKIIGTCLGEYVKEEDVLYDPLTDTYKIKAGDKIMEIPSYALQSENVRTLREALSNIDDENIKMTMLGAWAKSNSQDTSTMYIAKEIADKMQEAAIGLKQHPRLADDDDDINAKYRRTYLGDWGPTGAPLDSQSQDPLRARVEAGGYGLGASVRPVDSGDWSVRFTDKAAEKLRANSVYGSSLGSAQAHTSAPWDDPLAADLTAARNTVACMDMPEYMPDYNPNMSPKIYYHDRYPSIPIRSIIDDAIDLLNAKKNLHISKISFSQSHPDFRLAISSDSPNRPGFKRILEVLINHAAFDRAYSTDIDKYAKLKARLDTNTYMKLRIAFLLYEALKLNDSDAKKISLDIFKIIGSDTRPNFNI